MQDVTLAHVLLTLDGALDGNAELLYRAYGDVVVEADKLHTKGLVEFSTYLNALSLGKWKKYTFIEDVFLELEVSGDPCEVALLEHILVGDEGHTEVLDVVSLPGGEEEAGITCKISFPSTEASLVSFALLPKEGGVSTLHRACYSAAVPKEQIRHVELAIATTTFRKEEYILPTIEKIRTGLLNGSSFDDALKISEHLQMIVVDNGRTLDAEALSDDLVTVVPNPNAGGSGGFARGMMEALARNCTHVLLMDDDVVVSIESFWRTFVLLSLVRDTYQEACINGAMLRIEKPSSFHEDVGVLAGVRGYAHIKPDLDMSKLSDVVRCETIDVEIEHAYGAWWYDCIPLELVRRNGLPLPLFVRCDDVEFGLRNQATYMTMNGICVWHASFEVRRKAHIDHYQNTRNYLIMLAVDRPVSAQAFIFRTWRMFATKLREMDYGAADLILDALEDYLAGPEWLAAASGEELMREKSKKNEELTPVEQLDADVMAKTEIDQEFLDNTRARTAIVRACAALPFDQHWLPDAVLSNNPLMVHASYGFGPKNMTGLSLRRTLVAMDPSGEVGHVRTMDRARHRSLVKRAQQVKRAYRQHHTEVEAAYREALPYLTSEGFWRHYLGIDET